MKIAIISSSVREGRLSHRVALFLNDYVARATGAETEVLDLKAYDFPLFHERIFMMEKPPESLSDYVERFNSADGLIIVTPVYNASYPAALKNVIDVLFSEWVHKPVLVVSVTDKSTPGIATIQSLQTLLLKLGARVVGQLYTVLNAGVDFSETGEPMNPEAAERYAKTPVAELAWMVRKSME